MRSHSECVVLLFLVCVLGLPGCRGSSDDAAANETYFHGIYLTRGQFLSLETAARTAWKKINAAPRDPSLAVHLHRVSDQCDLLIADVQSLSPAPTFADFHRKLLQNLRKVEANAEEGESAVVTQRSGDIVRLGNEIEPLFEEQVELLSDFYNKEMWIRPQLRTLESEKGLPTAPLRLTLHLPSTPYATIPS